MEWEPVDEELELCPRCGRPLAWWTEPPRHGKHPTGRRTTCACGARYAVGGDGHQLSARLS
jgi:hypothetical protein